MGTRAWGPAAGTGLWLGALLGGCWFASTASRLFRAMGTPAPVAPGEVLTMVVAVGGVAAATWLWLGLLIALLGHLPGRAGRWCREVAQHTTPGVVRRCAAVVVGAGLVGALAPGTAIARTGDSPAGVEVASLSPGFAPTSPTHGVAVAAATGPAHGAAVAVGPAPALARPVHADTSPPGPGWTPSRPLVRPQPSMLLLTTAPTPDERSGVVVRRGDTLWDIVRAHLGRDATDAEVAAEWPRWHEANRAVIGGDPDFLLPGQVLHAPATTGVLR